jgi:uncharacterized membrane protein YhaH (DUF805 family)
MNFQTAIKTCFKKYGVFNGRASRSEFWFFILGCFLVGLALSEIDGVFGLSKKNLQPIWSLITVLFPALAVTIWYGAGPSVRLRWRT